MNELINNCTNCPYQNCPRISPSKVFKSDVAIVGMAPGREELIANKPFVGRSGDLLHQTLSKSGFTSTPFITNALLCMPPDDKNVKRGAIEACRPRVIQELSEVQPKIIIALGNIALASLFNDYKLKIGSIHSKPIQTKWGLVIPIYHPSKILRTPGDYKTFLNGFIYAKTLLDKPTAIKDPGITEYISAYSSNYQSLINFLLGFKILSCDIETTGLDPKTDKVTLIGFGYAKNKAVIFTPEFLPDLLPIFNTCQVIYHRSQFDTAVLSENGIETEADHDTILQHYTINENEGNHDLKTLAKTLLGADDYKDEMQIDLCTYLAKDCDYTYQLNDLFLLLIESDPNLKKLYYQILIPGINFLRRTTQKGFYVSMDYLAKYKNKIMSELDILRQQTVDSFGKLWDRELYLSETKAKSAPQTLNINGKDQIRWLVFDRMKLHPRITKRTTTGKLSVDKEVLESINSKPPAIESLLKYSRLHKLYTTYIVGIEDKVESDSRLRSTFSLQRTVTGRLSSADPNIQNIPRDPEVKNIFVAPQDKLLIEADYSQLELRLLAYFSKDPFLIDCFRQGRDLHNEMSVEIYGERFTEEERVAVKGLNFGAVYGRTAWSISQEFNIPQREAEILLAKWYRRIPIAKKYLEDCEKQLLSGKPFITPFGRYRRYGLITDEKSQRNEARNFTIQSTGSDLTLVSAMTLESLLVELDSFIVNIIHDSIIIEVPNDKAKVIKVIDLINTIMTQTPNKWLDNPEINFPVDIKAGFSWGYMKKIDIVSKEIIE